MPAQSSNCSFCQYWRTMQPGLGECRRNAPTLVMIVETDVESISNKAIWPRTFATEWCGDFELGTAVVEVGPEDSAGHVHPFRAAN